MRARHTLSASRRAGAAGETERERKKNMSDQSAAMRLVVVGAAGRMGQTLIRAIHSIPGATVAAAIERKGSPQIGQDAGHLAGIGTLGVAISDDPLPAFAKADGVLDFTAPAATVEFAGYAAQARIVHVIGTTGCAVEDDAKIAAAARHATVVKSGNMSLGVNLLAALVEQAAKALGPDDFDIEILEMHHRHKVDAPSGTALLLGEAAAKGRSVGLAENSVRVRDGHTGARKPGTIGFATLRGGSVVGEHSVFLSGPGERITLSHHAEDRAIFARGAVKAALWARGRKAGLYSMRDVLGFGAA
jgi:4-hydroxy-tetrahydrodipicolinate reductase